MLYLGDFIFSLNFKAWPIWWLIGPIIRRWSKEVFVLYCPRCHFDNFDFYEEPYFECTDGGRWSSPEGTVYWFEGTQQCPRCHHKFFVHDSS